MWWSLNHFTHSLVPSLIPVRRNWECVYDSRSILARLGRLYHTYTSLLSTVSTNHILAGINESEVSQAVIIAISLLQLGRSTGESPYISWK